MSPKTTDTASTLKYSPESSREEDSPKGKKFSFTLNKGIKTDSEKTPDRDESPPGDHEEKPIMQSVLKIRGDTVTDSEKIEKPKFSETKTVATSKQESSKDCQKFKDRFASESSLASSKKKGKKKRNKGKDR